MNRDLKIMIAPGVLTRIPTRSIRSGSASFLYL